MHFNRFKGSLIIAPPTSFASPWIRKFKDHSTAIASGWIGVREMKYPSDIGFELSDHADWKGLNAAVKATEASHIYVTHGYTDLYSKHLREQGYDAKIVKTEY